MNTAAKGRRNEHRSMAIFEAAGYECLRAAASKGAWDFVAISATDIVLCQVKSTRWPRSEEMEQLQLFRVPAGVRKLVHRWKARARKPEVMEL